jgi:glutamyl-Q tRNA(Asp) synthetase
LHFGSLVAALVSFLRARQAGGKWLLRIEDLDPPRQPPEAVDQILTALRAHHLEWDEQVTFQGQRTPLYHDAVQVLAESGLLYECTCSRSAILEAGAREVDPELGPIYPGTCKSRPRIPGSPAALRIRVPPLKVSYSDLLQGYQVQHLSEESGDFVIRRKDGLHAYNLAVVVDDAAQGVTEVVRGTDLLSQTPRQIYLQQSLGLSIPRYLHFPVAVSESGQKLSKQSGACAVRPGLASENLAAALEFLGLDPPLELAREPAPVVLEWGLRHFDPMTLAGVLSKPVPIMGGLSDD